MSNEIFDQQLALSMQRLEELWRRADKLPQLSVTPKRQSEEFPEVSQELLRQSLTELTCSLEELQVIVEELHQQNQELLESRMAVDAERQRYQELFELALDGYLVTTEDGTILEANQTATDLFNISKKRVVGKPLVIFIDAEARQDFYSKLKQLQTGESIKNWHVRIQRRRGVCFTASIAVLPIQDSQGKVQRLRWRLLELTSIQNKNLIQQQSVSVQPWRHENSKASPHPQEARLDEAISDRKQLKTAQPQVVAPLAAKDEELLGVSTPRIETPSQHLGVSVEQLGKVLNDILSSSSDFLFICDRAGKYIYVNVAAANAWNLTQSDFIGKSWRQVELPAKIVEQFEAQQETVFATGSSLCDRASFPIGEELRDYEYTMTKFSDINSSREVVVVTFKEVTEHKRAVVAANGTLAKEAESSTHKSRFTSVFAHELRNPINNILACSKLLENNTQPEVDTKKLDYLQRIQVNIKRINQLLDDLLLLGKVEAGQIQLKPALIDLTEFCRRVMKELQQDAGSQHKIIFSTQGKPCGVWDEKLLRQTLRNLLLNAIQSSPKGSEIQLEVVAQGREVIFRIQDSGNGIPEEEQELLGNAFQEGTNVGLIEGNSLRLLLVKQCVEVQKGDIFIENQVDVGTTFTVTLPLNQRVAKKK